MPKVDKIPCPTPGCGEQLPVKTTKTGKPYVSCQECGFDGYARKQKSIRAFFGDGDKPAPPSEKKPSKDEWDW